MFLGHDFVPIQNQSHFTESRRTYKNAYFYNPVYSLYHRLYLSCFLATLNIVTREVVSLRDMKEPYDPTLDSHNIHGHIKASAEPSNQETNAGFGLA